MRQMSVHMIWHDRHDMHSDSVISTIMNSAVYSTCKAVKSAWYFICSIRKSWRWGLTEWVRASCGCLFAVRFIYRSYVQSGVQSGVRHCTSPTSYGRRSRCLVRKDLSARPVLLSDTQTASILDKLFSQI